jgi:FKBP-type peptidyl-prolyl cis-trans isomerase
VVRAGSDDGEPHGQVDRFVTTKEFDGDETLIVVHGDDEVVFAVCCSVKERVGGMGACGVDPRGSCRCDGGGDDVEVFFAEQALLTRVWVEPEDRDAWLRDSEPGACGCAELDGLEDAVGCELVGDGCEWDVGCDEDDAQAGRIEHHREARAAAAMGEQFCVPGIRSVPRIGPGEFVDRGGDDSVGVVGMIAREQSGVDGCVDPSEREVAALFGGLGGKVGVVRSRIGFDDADAAVLGWVFEGSRPVALHVERPGGLVEHARVAEDDEAGAHFAPSAGWTGERRDDDLGPDAARVAHGNRDGRRVVGRRRHGGSYGHSPPGDRVVLPWQSILKPLVAKKDSLMLRMKMMAMVGGVALVSLGLGCAEETATPSDSASAGESANSPSEVSGGEAAGAAAGETIEGFGGQTFSVISTTTLGSGVIIDELRIGEGEACPAGATVTIQYHGTLTDGTVFDSTRGGNAGGPWPLARLIRGWQEGVPGMKVGGVRRLTIPYQLGYGEAGSPPAIPAKADLTFVIEMVSFQ